ncbi:MAG TPA: 3-oxoacyl-ACP synthase III [Elusimicrobiota bacterium]|jgi:3-oxoacyl-[acyl-carrier-protein] synthase-3|nr:3-oxoacyl-ACP synthase III [Elusimicrobiota bacterium]
MRYTRVHVPAIGYELPATVVSSESLERRLEPVYRALGIQAGQLEAFTGIRERRWWEPGFRLSEGAIRAGRKALAQAGMKGSDLGAVIYAGVCRESFEPATACAVAEALGAPPEASVFDVSNACLGVLNGMVDIANRIELGQIRAGLVVSCESAREINDLTAERLLKDRSMENFKYSIATLTGGSGAVAVLLTDDSIGPRRRRLLGGFSMAAPEFHRICRWGLVDGVEVMRTDSVAVLKNGIELGRRTWERFLGELGWAADAVSKVICHQVGSGHQKEILSRLGLSADKDFTTYEFLGNIGTVSLPITAAIAEERDFLRPGDAVGFLGIGSGLNCMMLGLEW